jgi:hypothetical protein
MLLNTLNAQLLAIESVHLVVEVRSRGNDLKDVSKSLRAVRALKPSQGIRRSGTGATDPPLHTLVIYQGPKQPRTLMRTLAKVNAISVRKGTRLVIDFVLVLATVESDDPSTGYLIGYGRTDEEGRRVRHHYYPKAGQWGLDGPTVIEAGSGAFAMWYAAVLNHLNGVKAYPPFLYEYLGRKVRIINTNGENT